MTDLYELPNRPAARVAICRESIEDALSRGFTLKEIAARLDVRYKTFWQAWKEARIVVPLEKQLPLPAPVPPERKCFRVAHDSSSSNKESAETEASEPKKKVLPRVSGNGQKQESEMSAAERIIANLPHI